MNEFEKSAASTLRSLSLNPYDINALKNLGVAYASSRKERYRRTFLRSARRHSRLLILAPSW
jgi:hypothetical protein